MSEIPRTPKAPEASLERMPQRAQKRKSILRLLIIVFIVGGLIYTFQNISPEELRANVQAWLVPMGIWAPVIFTLLFVTNTVGMPISWLNGFAGVLFGFKVGMIVAVVGTLCSGVVTFLVSRSLLSSWAKNKLADDPKLDLVNKLIARRGRLILPMIRIPPVSHYTTVNILLSLTAVKLPTFMVTTVLGMLPICFFFVLTGNAVNVGLDALTISALAGGAVICVLLTWLIYVDVKAIRAEERALQQLIS